MRVDRAEWKAGMSGCKLGCGGGLAGCIEGRFLAIFLGAVLGVFLYARVLSSLWGFDRGIYGVGVRGIIIIYSILYRGT